MALQVASSGAFSVFGLADFAAVVEFVTCPVLGGMIIVRSDVTGLCPTMSVLGGGGLMISVGDAVNIGPGVVIQSGAALWKSGSGNMTFMGPLSNSGSAIFDGGGVLFGAPVHSGF